MTFLSHLIILTTFISFLTATAHGSVPDIIGTNQSVITHAQDDFFSIARQYDVGYDALVNANPSVDPTHPRPGTVLIIPTRHIVPPEVRFGVVINLAEKRLYYYDPKQASVITHPVGIGKKGWKSPQGSMKIIEKRYLPHWNVPDSIMDLQASQGIILPESLPPGPVNPLGKYAMRLSNPSYLIHGTNYPKGIGRRVSSGCFQLYPEDIESLYKRLPLNTKVIVIDRPTKLAKRNNQVLIEHHKPLLDSDNSPTSPQALTQLIQSRSQKPTNPNLLRWIIHDHNGLTQQVTS